MLISLSGGTWSALSPVAADLVSRLAGSPVLAAGGVWDVVPDDPSYPFVFFEVFENPIDSYGGGVQMMEIVLHVFSVARGMKEGRGILSEAINRLRDSSYYLHDQSMSWPNELVRGRQVTELIGRFRAFAST